MDDSDNGENYIVNEESSSSDEFTIDERLLFGCSSSEKPKQKKGISIAKILEEITQNVKEGKPRKANAVTKAKCD